LLDDTKHSVKFWFIEQFLSPSFRAFLPSLAREYGFSYEMVTYKWPHWLRAQKEKQREIWGYKNQNLTLCLVCRITETIIMFNMRS
jgi:hypothetical protein